MLNVGFSINIYGLNVELHGEALSAGAGFEITNQRIGAYFGAGWLGGGLAISWG